jgi:hypothetical protein
MVVLCIMYVQMSNQKGKKDKTPFGEIDEGPSSLYM